MKTWIKKSFVVPMLVASLGSMLVCQAEGQSFTVLHHFTATSTNSLGVLTNGDGAAPVGGLILSGDTLYGAAAGGGRWGHGLVFRVKSDGTGFATVYSSTVPGEYGGFSLSWNTLYGTATPTDNSSGIVFTLNTDGTGLTTLHSFAPWDASVPYGIIVNSDGAGTGNLILSGDTLYGTAASGGTAGSGTVFTIKTNGMSFTVLYSFTATIYSGNSDGADPQGGLTLAGDTLYGTASGGGSGNGTVFAINIDGTHFRLLHSFSPLPGLYPATNDNGAYPDAGLVLSGNTLYGTTSRGGTSGNGTIFAVSSDGTGFSTLYAFTQGSGSWYSSIINNDGAGPGGLALSGNTLYGTTSGGGTSANGTVFAINKDGTGFTTLHSFTSTSGPFRSGTNSDGAVPSGRLILSGNALYGTAGIGGSFGSGTVFSISFSPQLTTVQSQGSLVLSWPTNYAGFDYSGYTLESATNLGSPAWTSNLPTPAMINGQKSVTVPVTGTQQFYRLRQRLPIPPNENENLPIGGPGDDVPVDRSGELSP
jgi:uncharacterized repeat protein (TIGR03803 family)